MVYPIDYNTYTKNCAKLLKNIELNALIVIKLEL